MSLADAYILRSVKALAKGRPPPLPAEATGKATDETAPIFPVSSYRGLGRRILVARYRRWWRRMLKTPYGHCSCGCGGKTQRAEQTSVGRGTVAGEPRPFLPHHRRRWGRPALTDPDRRCACGCGRSTPVVRDSARDGEGEPIQFAGMRAKYLNADHRPPPALPDLTLTTPLGSLPCTPGEDGLPEEDLRWLAGVVDAHLSFSRDRGKLRPKVQSTDGRMIDRFLVVSGRGRVDASQPDKPGASPMYKWSGRSSLEMANVLTELYDLLGPQTRERVRVFLGEMEFPTPPHRSLLHTRLGSWKRQ